MLTYLGPFRGDDSASTPNQAQRRQVHPSELSHSMIDESVLEDSGARDLDGNPLMANPLMSWDEMGLEQEDFGFLGRFDVPDLASWFSDVQDPAS